MPYGQVHTHRQTNTHTHTHNALHILVYSTWTGSTLARRRTHSHTGSLIKWHIRHGCVVRTLVTDPKGTAYKGLAHSASIRHPVMSIPREIASSINPERLGTAQSRALHQLPSELCNINKSNQYLVNISLWRALKAVSFPACVSFWFLMWCPPQSPREMNFDWFGVEDCSSNHTPGEMLWRGSLT